MAKTDPGEALTTTWELLFSCDDAGGSDGEPAKCFTVRRLAASADSVLVFADPEHGQSVPTDATVGYLLDADDPKCVIPGVVAGSGRGSIRRVWARALASTASITYARGVL